MKERENVIRAAEECESALSLFGIAARTFDL
jgi:hypothetical protein